jgi:hypothetical protein
MLYCIFLILIVSAVQSGTITFLERLLHFLDISIKSYKLFFSAPLNTTDENPNNATSTVANRVVVKRQFGFAGQLGQFDRLRDSRFQSTRFSSFNGFGGSGFGSGGFGGSFGRPNRLGFVDDDTTNINNNNAGGGFGSSSFNNNNVGFNINIRL